jgi:tetratricopeptide (TPR) repeat protein
MDPAVYAYYERLSRNPDDAEALYFLWEHHGGRGEFQQLAQLVEQTAARRAVPASAADLYYRAGELWAKNVGRADKAVACYKRAFDLDASQLQAAEAARQIYIQLGNYRPAAQLLSDQLGRTADPLLRSLLLREGVQIYGQIPDWDTQIAYLEEILGGTPDDWEMLRELAGAYLSRSQGPGAQPDDAQRAAQVLGGLAQNVGGEHGLAFAEAALDAFAGDEAAYAIVHEAYYRADRAQDLALRQIAFLSANPTSAYAPTIRRGLAEMYSSVGQLDDAIACLEPLAAEDLDVARELSSLYRSAGRVDDLAQLLAQFAPTADPAERMRDLKDLAELYGNQGNRGGMLGAMREVLALDPADPEALALVEDDLRARGEHAELREVMAEAVRCEHCPAEMRAARLREIASLSLDHLDDPESAMHAWRELLDGAPDDADALRGLDQIFTRAGDWAQLADVLDREVQAAPDGARKALLLRRADVARDQLDDPEGEREALAAAWREDPDDDDLTDRLLALYREREDLYAAAEALEVRAQRAPAHLAVDRWRELALARAAAGDGVGAVDALREALRLDPTNEEILDALDRALETAGDLQARFDLLRQRAGAMARGPARAALHARASAAARALGDSATALDEAEVAVAMDPSNESLALTIIDALDALGQHPRLVAFLHERLQHVFGLEQRSNLLRRAAQVLGASDPPAAVQYWEELRALRAQHGVGDDPEALQAIAGFAEQAGDLPRVVRLLEEAASASTDADSRRALLSRRAHTLLGGLGRSDEGLDALRHVAHNVAPEHLETWRSLEGAAISLGRKEIALEAMQRQVSLTEEGDDARSELSARAVALSESSHDDPSLSFELLRAAHDADPGDLGLTQRVADAAEAMERWPEAVAMLRELIEVEGDDEEIARLTLHVASLYDAHLDAPREAWDLLLPLARAGDLGCVEMLQDLSTRRGYDAELVPLLDELAERVQDDDARADLSVEAARRTARSLGDLDAALGHAVRAVIAAPQHDGAVALLAELTPAATSAGESLPGWQAAVERAPDGTSAHDRALRGVECLTAAGATAAALDLCLGALAKAPADDDLLDAAVRLAPDSGRDQDVFIALDRRKKAAQTDAERLTVTLRAMEVAAVAVRDAEAALQYLDQAVALSISRKALDEARIVEVESAARAIDEASPDAGMITALVERLAQRADDCLDEDPRSAASLLRRAGDLCARDLSLDEHAWTLYGRAVTAWPGDGAGADALEACGERLGRLDDVVKRYARVIDDAYDAGVARAYTQRRATILAERLGRVDEALAALQRVVEIAPKDLEAIRRWQELLERSSRWQDLLIAIEREMEAGGDRTGCLRRMARIWEQQLHNTHEARQLWRRVLRGAAEDPEAREALQRLDRRSADLDDDAPPAPLVAPAPVAAPVTFAALAPAEPPAPVIDLVAEAKAVPQMELREESAEVTLDPRSAFFEPDDEVEAPTVDPRLAFFEPEAPAEEDAPAVETEDDAEELLDLDDVDAVAEHVESAEESEAELDPEPLDEPAYEDDAEELMEPLDDETSGDPDEPSELDEPEGDGSLDDLARMIAPPRRGQGSLPPAPPRAPPPLPPVRRRDD